MSYALGEATEGLENEAELYRFTYITVHSTALSLLHLRHRHVTYVTWRAAHAPMMMFNTYISMMIL